MIGKCSIIIRTLNEARYVGELLESIAGHGYPRELIETIVIDSGSTDATLEIAARHGCNAVRITRDQFSFGRSLNRGCEAKEQSSVASRAERFCRRARKYNSDGLVS